METENKFTGSSGNSQADVENARGTHSVSRTRLICSSAVVSVTVIVLGALILTAIYKDADSKRDYVSMLLPVLSALITGFLGFIAGQRNPQN